MYACSVKFYFCINYNMYCISLCILIALRKSLICCLFYLGRWGQLIHCLTSKNIDIELNTVTKIKIRGNNDNAMLYKMLHHCRYYNEMTSMNIDIQLLPILKQKLKLEAIMTMSLRFVFSRIGLQCFISSACQGKLSRSMQMIGGHTA